MLKLMLRRKNNDPIHIEGSTKKCKIKNTFLLQLTMADMQLCFNKSKPSVDASDIKKYRQFMDKFGQAG